MRGRDFKAERDQEDRLKQLRHERDNAKEKVMDELYQLFEIDKAHEEEDPSLSPLHTAWVHYRSLDREVYETLGGE